jgi:hypothetical protein
MRSPCCLPVCPHNCSIFYAVCVVSKESRRFVLPRTFCFTRTETSNGAHHWWGTASADAYTVLPRQTSCFQIWRQDNESIFPFTCFGGCLQQKKLYRISPSFTNLTNAIGYSLQSEHNALLSGAVISAPCVRHGASRICYLPLKFNFEQGTAHYYVLYVIPSWVSFIGLQLRPVTVQRHVYLASLLRASL